MKKLHVEYSGGYEWTFEVSESKKRAGMVRVTQRHTKYGGLVAGVLWYGGTQRDGVDELNPLQHAIYGTGLLMAQIEEQQATATLGEALQKADDVIQNITEDDNLCLVRTLLEAHFMLKAGAPAPVAPAPIAPAGVRFRVYVEDFDPKDERRTITTYEEFYDNEEDAQDDFDSLMAQGQEPKLEKLGGE